MSCVELSAVLPQPLGALCLGSVGTPQVETDYSLEGALVAYLGSRQVSCLIGCRFYPHFVARNNQTWPAVTYYRSSTDHQQGVSGAAGYAIAHISLDVWSPVYSDVVQVAEAIRQSMQGFQGWMSSTPILAVSLDGEDDQVERPGDGSSTWWFSRSLDYSFMFTESKPQF